MATSTVTPEVNSSAIPPSAISSPASTAPTEASAPTATPESTTSSAPQPGESAQNGELSPQDFSSLEDYAKALIEKKQSTASTPQSETADSDATAPDLKEIELSEAQPEETNEESQPRAA